MFIATVPWADLDCRDGWKILNLSGLLKIIAFSYLLMPFSSLIKGLFSRNKRHDTYSKFAGR